MEASRNNRFGEFLALRSSCQTPMAVTAIGADPGDHPQPSIAKELIEIVHT